MASTRSATVRVIGPTVSKSSSIAGNPSQRGTRPLEGLSPTRPVCDAGRRIDPPPSVPIATGPSPAHTAATAPPLEPPGVNDRFHGFRVGPKTRLSVYPCNVNSGQFVFPSTTAPPLRSRKIRQFVGRRNKIGVELASPGRPKPAHRNVVLYADRHAVEGTHCRTALPSRLARFCRSTRALQRRVSRSH